MAKDPVCGMDVDERLTPDQSEYQGKIHFFCSPGCKDRFERGQARFVEGRPAERGSRRKTGA